MKERPNFDRDIRREVEQTGKEITPVDKEKFYLCKKCGKVLPEDRICRECGYNNFERNRT